MVTKLEMEGRLYRSKKHDGGGKKGGIKNYIFTCSTPQFYCTAKYNAKIQAQGHGSEADALRCITKYLKLNNNA